jgi:hypothetical protein
VDASWDHCGKEGMHFIDVSDGRSGRAVNFEIIVKKSDFPDGYFDGRSSAMEVAVFQSLLSRLRPDPHVRYVMTDKDSKLRHEILMSGQNAEYKVDKNHPVKALARFWDLLATADQKPLFELKDRLTAFLAHVLQQQLPVDHRIATWSNTETYCCGDHSARFDFGHTGYNWSGRNHAGAVRISSYVIGNGAKLIGYCNPQIWRYSWMVRSTIPKPNSANSIGSPLVL